MKTPNVSSSTNINPYPSSISTPISQIDHSPAEGHLSETNSKVVNLKLENQPKPSPDTSLDDTSSDSNSTPVPSQVDHSLERQPLVSTASKVSSLEIPDQPKSLLKLENQPKALPDTSPDPQLSSLDNHEFTPDPIKEKDVTPEWKKLLNKILSEGKCVLNKAEKLFVENRAIRMIACCALGIGVIAVSVLAGTALIAAVTGAAASGVLPALLVTLASFVVLAGGITLGAAVIGVGFKKDEQEPIPNQPNTPPKAGPKPRPKSMEIPSSQDKQTLKEELERLDKKRPKTTDDIITHNRLIRDQLHEKALSEILEEQRKKEAEKDQQTSPPIDEATLQKRREEIEELKNPSPKPQSQETSQPTSTSPPLTKQQHIDAHRKKWAEEDRAKADTDQRKIEEEKKENV